MFLIFALIKSRTFLDHKGWHIMDNRLDRLAENFVSRTSRIALMREYGNSKSSFVGENAHGEDVFLSVYTDRIIVSTMQSNGWVRTNFYDAQGNLEGETYKPYWGSEKGVCKND
mgnify:CR=1 FL=1